MTEFRAGDLVYWVFPSGDKTPCTVKKLSGDRMWVLWHKDGFVNLMPKSGFILAEEKTNE